MSERTGPYDPPAGAGEGKGRRDAPRTRTAQRPDAFARWSERRRQVAEAEAPPPPSDPEAEEAARAALERNREAAEALDVEALGPGSDVSALLREGVPDALRRTALKALWRSDPVFANVDRLCDYDDDFRDPKMILATLQSAWQAGRGYLFADEPPVEDVDEGAAEGDAETVPDPTTIADGKGARVRGTDDQDATGGEAEAASPVPAPRLRRAAHGTDTSDGRGGSGGDRGPERSDRRPGPQCSPGARARRDRGNAADGRAAPRPPRARCGVLAPRAAGPLIPFRVAPPRAVRHPRPSAMEGAMIFTGMASERVAELRAGGADANGQAPERTVSHGGDPCRHCLGMIGAGEPMLVLAHRPFYTVQPYAEVGPAFLHAEPCEPPAPGDALPPCLDSPAYLLRGYGSDERIVYGTGAVTARGEIGARASTLLADGRVAFVHVRSASNNCWQARIDR